MVARKVELIFQNFDKDSVGRLDKVGGPTQSVETMKQDVQLACHARRGLYQQQQCCARAHKKSSCHVYGRLKCTGRASNLARPSMQHHQKDLLRAGKGRKLHKDGQPWCTTYGLASGSNRG